MTRQLDFHTADNAEVPAVVVYDVATEETVATFPILRAGVDAAEREAIAFIAEEQPK